MPITSFVEMIPTGVPFFSITGRCLTFSFIILSTAVRTLSLGMAMMDVFDMIEETGTCRPTKDLVTANIMSLAVIMPAILPSLSTTMTLPILFSHIVEAASSMVVSSLTTMGGASMKSFTFALRCSAVLDKGSDALILSHITVSPCGLAAGVI